jgi:hypothetical protein
MTIEKKPLPRQNTPTNLTGLDARLGILIIEGKNQKGRHLGGLYLFARDSLNAERFSPTG